MLLGEKLPLNKSQRKVFSSGIKNTTSITVSSTLNTVEVLFSLSMQSTVHYKHKMNHDNKTELTPL